MPLPRIAVYALGGTIAMVQGDSGGVKPGLGADDLARAVPQLPALAEIAAETFAMVGSPSLPHDLLFRLAARIQREADAGTVDGVVVTQGTDTIEETAFLLDCLLDVAVPVIVIGAMRNPLMVSPDGAGNLLAAVRVATDARIRRHAGALGVLVVMLDRVHAAVDVAKGNGHRIDAFRSAEAGPLAVLIEDRVVLSALPLRDWKPALAGRLGARPAERLAAVEAPVALLTMALGETGGLLRALAAAPDRLGYRGAVLALMGGGHAPDWLADDVSAVAAALPTVGAGRMGAGPLLRGTYEMTGGEIDLQRRGVVWAGRLPPLKARVLLDLLLRAGCDRDAIDAQFRAFE